MASIWTTTILTLTTTWDNFLPRLRWLLATAVAFLGGIWVLSLSKINAKHWDSFLKMNGWSCWIMLLIDVSVAGAFTKWGPIQFEVLASYGGFFLKSILEIAVCMGSAEYSNYITMHGLVDSRLISSVVIFAFHSLSLGRISWPGVDVTCMILLIQSALSFGFELKTKEAFPIIAAASFLLFFWRSFLESRDIIRRANHIKSKKRNLDEDAGVGTGRGAAQAVDAKEMSWKLKLVWWFLTVAAFLGTLILLSFSKLNSKHWHSFLRTSGNCWLWIIFVVYSLIVGGIACKGPIRFEVLANRWGFVLKSFFETVIFSGAAWLLNFIDQKKAIDGLLMASLILFACHSLTLGRILWPGVDIGCMVLIIEMAVNVSINEASPAHPGAFIGTGIASFLLLLARAYFESGDIIRRAGKVDKDSSNRRQLRDEVVELAEAVDQVVNNPNSNNDVNVNQQMEVENEDADENEGNDDEIVPVAN